MAGRGRAVVSGGRFQGRPSRAREANLVTGADAGEQSVQPVPQSPDDAFSMEQRANKVIEVSGLVTLAVGSVD